MLRIAGKSIVDDAQYCVKHLSSPCLRSQILHRCISTDTSNNTYSIPPKIRRQPDSRSSSPRRNPRPGEETPRKPWTTSPKSKKAYGTAKDEEQRKKRLLTPYKLALQLKDLCAEGDFKGAVTRLKNVPLDAQNVPVWNTLMSECVQAQRHQLAYELYIDMKRRGFSPTTATYTTLFMGLSRITNWSAHPKQLTHAHTLYENFLKHLEAVKFHEPDNMRELNTTPITLYMKVLGLAGDYQKIFDVYFAMDQEGPLTPNKYVFTTMFQSILERQVRDKADEEISVHNRAASDAKHVWMQMEKVMQKNPKFELDPFLIGSALRALARGRPNDQSFALEIIRDHLGLTKPGESAPHGFSKHLTNYTLDAALQICNAMQKHRLCIHFVKQVIAKNPMEKSYTRELVDSTHILWMLKSYAGLASLGSLNESSQVLEALEWALENQAVYDLPKLRPSPFSYHIAMMTCWRSGDWAAALRTLELMTGIMPDEFHVSGGREAPKVQERSRSRSMYADVHTMSYLLRTALSTNDHRNMRQAMWLVEYMGVTELLVGGKAPYYKSKFAIALLDILNHLQKSGDEGDSQLQRWLSWRSQAREVARATKSSPIPEQEGQILGSDRAVAATDNFIAFEMASRNSKARK